MTSSIGPTAIRGPHKITQRRQVINPAHVIDSVRAGNRRIIVESGIEAAAVYYFEGDPTVTQITEQALKIPVPRTGSDTTTLDLGIQRLDGTEIIYEIKPKNKLVENALGEWVPPNWDNIQAWSKDNGWEIDFITDEMLSKSKIAIHNWRCLLPYVWYCKENPDPELSLEIYQLISQSDGITSQDLTESISRCKTPRISYEVADLLHRGKIRANLDKTLLAFNTPLFGENKSDES